MVVTNVGRRLIVAALLVYAGVVYVFAEDDEDYRPGGWQEEEVVFPPVPEEKNLKGFFVSAAIDNRYAVDLASISVGKDGVVRYVLVVDTPGGSRNVTYEGMRCETKEKRLYATGRRDGRWISSRNVDWERIVDTPPRRQHAALFLEYFCPGATLVRDAEEARNALIQGVHPLNRMR